jgi:hypothetical protein
LSGDSSQTEPVAPRAGAKGFWHYTGLAAIAITCLVGLKDLGGSALMRFRSRLVATAEVNSFPIPQTFARDYLKLAVGGTDSADDWWQRRVSETYVHVPFEWGHHQFVWAIDVQNLDDAVARNVIVLVPYAVEYQVAVEGRKLVGDTTSGTISLGDLQPSTTAHINVWTEFGSIGPGSIKVRWDGGVLEPKYLRPVGPFGQLFDSVSDHPFIMMFILTWIAFMVLMFWIEYPRATQSRRVRQKSIKRQVNGSV